MKFGKKAKRLGQKMFKNVYSGKKVLVTGHTGFKGSWLALWLEKLGAEVYGLSLSVPTEPAHYELLNLKKSQKKEFLIDIRNYEAVQKAFDEIHPEIVFHLAAEPIVKTCLDNPKDAFDTNLGGSVNIFEAIRKTESIKSAVIITSDKCYENVEWDYGYREDDRLGGKDPYSASKACVEIAFSAYYRSYFSHNQNLRISTTRAGNVIGGGDWAKDRIIPDCVRAVTNHKDLIIRSPYATRPWQLVLEPLSGYLSLGAELYLDRKNEMNLNGQAFNFGPNTDVEVTVEGVLTEMKKHWQLISWKVDTADQYAKKEAGLLKLTCDRSLRRLKWKPVLNFSETIKFTTEWYMQWQSGINIEQLSNKQIDDYIHLAKERKLSWTE